ncbi:MAG: cytochrome c family protein [bacterium]
MKRLFSFFAILSFLVLCVQGDGQDKAADKKVAFKYGGVKTCKACHLVAKSGAQYKIWAKGPHARAYETLKTPKSQETAKKLGIDDPLKSEKCLKCHVTAFGVKASLKGPKLKLEEGVSCEACHGPGSVYKKRQIMKDIFAGKVKGAKYGLVLPTEKVCVKCHNSESPFYKGFDFKKMAAKIAHPVPKKSAAK